MDHDAVVDESSGAIERAYRSDAVRLWRALVGFTGDREIADDAVAETFARALHHENEIRDLRSWVWRVAFRVAAVELRRLQFAQADEGIGANEPSADVPELVAALKRLPENQRLAMVLHDYADRPTSEVAAILGCSAATVHVHLSRGRRKLRGILEVLDA